ncbi:MAG: hypothetical protein EBZ48_14620 [Proteobacteria bacterium]|nr:hypothetical protein [Pseudomonadota bacterium]
MSLFVETLPFARNAPELPVFPEYQARSQQVRRAPSREPFRAPYHSGTAILVEDIKDIFVFSYFLTKAALKGFAIVAIPFWATAIGLLSLIC